MKRLRRFYFLFVFILYLSFSTARGSCSVQFEKITIEDGLSNNTVLSIAQDHDGRIWFATYDGLTCFDGLTFQTIRHVPARAKDQIPAGKPEQVVVDSAGNIWVLFEGNRLVRLTGTSGECISYPHVENSAPITLDLDKKGTILVTDSISFYKYHAGEDEFIRFIPDGYTSGSVILAGIKEQMLKIIPDVKVYSYFKEEDGKDLWVTTLNHGIFKIPDGNYSEAVNYHTGSPGRSAISSNEVYCVFVDKDGIIWAGTKDGGVNKGIRAGNSFRTMGAGQHPGSGFPEGAVRAIGKDKAGELWVGSYSNGISVLQDDQWTPVRFLHEQDNKWNWIRCIYQGTDGSVWVGSYAGLCRVEPESRQIKYYPPGAGKTTITHGRIYSMAEDRNGNLFVGEWGSLDYFDRKQKTFTRIDSFSALKDQHIRKLMLSSKGQLWVGTESKGVFVIDTTSYNVLAHYESNTDRENVLNSNSIFEIQEDADGQVWIGNFGGLNRIDRQGRVASFPKINERLPSTLIYKIFSAPDHKLWCSTTRGIVRIDVRSGKVRTYDRMDGADIVEFSEGAGFMDEHNRIYLGGVEGISYFYPDSVAMDLSVPDVLLETVSVNGKTIRIPYPANVESPLQFSSWEDDFSFHIKSILLSNPRKNEIAWKLVPYDKDFQHWNGAMHTVDYFGLPSGKYTLLARSANADGLWSEEEPVLSFVIEKPFWANFYFILLLSYFIALAVILFVRIRFTQVKKKNRLLEELIVKRTHKIEKQKLELKEANFILTGKNQKVQAQKDQILAQRDHLLEMYDKLEESNRLKENFFTNISHDIRTPLSLIYAPTCEILKDQTISPALRDKLERIHSNSKYVIRLLDQILDRKKLELGGLKEVRTHGDIMQSCHSIVRSFQDQAVLNRVRLVFISNKTEVPVRFDHGKLQQIVFNLLANALKFTPAGGKITCTLVADEKRIRVEVSDTGIGIPRDRIKHIFERYYQVGKSLNKDNRGTGIGLSLVKDFVDLLHGEITVDSEEGKGSRFVIELPYREAVQADEILSGPEVEHEDERLIQGESTSGDSNHPSFSDLVLLVEDNEDLRNYLTGFLSSYFEVIAVEDGKEALKSLKKNSAVSIVVSDWIMPEMDGIELCKALRKKTRFKSLPFILLTAMTELDNQKEGYFAGVDDFITKPFEPELLYLKIAGLLNRDHKVKHAAKASSLIQPENKAVETFDDKLLKKIMALMEKELSNPEFSQLELAGGVGMTPMQLYRKLKELVGMTPVEFIRSIRIKRAVQLLENENIIINEVSDLVGFNDPKYFSRCFSKETGMSPSKYRNTCLAKNFVP